MDSRWDKLHPLGSGAARSRGKRAALCAPFIVGALVLSACESRSGTSATPTPTPDPSATDTRGNLVLPLQEVASGYESLIEGTLIRRGRCILVRTASKNLYLPFWPPQTSYERTPAGLSIIHEGEVVARVGEAISLGGGGAVRPAALRDRAGGCPGRYWLVSTINTEV